MFSHLKAFGGFSLSEMALLYGTASMTLGVADLFTGSVERIGQRIRGGDLDVWLVRPVPAFIQAVSDNFALRRLGRPVQALIVMVVALSNWRSTGRPPRCCCWWCR